MTAPMNKGNMIFAIACAASLTIAGAVIIVGLTGSGSPGDDPDDHDDTGLDTYIGQYTKYTNTRTFLSPYSGTINISITDADEDKMELLYLVAYEIRGPFGGILYRDSYSMWLPFTDRPIAGLLDMVDLGEPVQKNVRLTGTINGTKNTDVYSDPAGLITAWIGVDDDVVYRMRTVVEGMDIVWNLSETTMKW